MLKRNSRSKVRTAYTGVNHAPPVGSEPDSAARAAALTIGHAHDPPLSKPASQTPSRSPSISRNPNRLLSYNPSAPRLPLGSSRRNSYDPSNHDAAFLDNVNQLRDLRLTHEPRQEKMVKKYIPTPSGIKVIEVPESTIKQEISRSNLMRSIPRSASLRGPKPKTSSRAPHSKSQSNSLSSSSSRKSSLQMRNHMRPVMESQESSPELLAIQQQIDAQKRLADQLLEKQAELERLQQHNKRLAQAAVAKQEASARVTEQKVQSARVVPFDVESELFRETHVADAETANEIVNLMPVSAEEAKVIAFGDYKESVVIDESHALPLNALGNVLEYLSPVLAQLEAMTPVVDAAASIQDKIPDTPVDEHSFVDAQASLPQPIEYFVPIALSSSENISAFPNESANGLELQSTKSNAGANHEFVPIELRDSMLDNTILDEEALDATFEASALAKILRPQYGGSSDHTEVPPAEPFPTERILSSDASTSLAYSNESNKVKPPIIKSALKSALSFSLTVHSISKKNLAHQAYLLLTTAENTRLNAKLSSGTLTEHQVLASQKGAAANSKRFSMSLRPQSGMVSPPATASSLGSMSARSLRPPTADPDLINRSRSGSGSASLKRPLSFLAIPPHPALQPNYQLPSKIKAAELYAKAQMRPVLTFRPPQNRKSSFSRDGQEELANGAPAPSAPPPRTLRAPKNFDENGNQVVSPSSEQRQRQPHGHDQNQNQNQPHAQARTSNLRMFKSRIVDSDDDDDFSAPESYQKHGFLEKVSQPATFGHHRLQLDLPQEQTRTISSNTTKLEHSGEKKRFGKLRRLFGKSKK